MTDIDALEKVNEGLFLFYGVMKEEMVNPDMKVVANIQLVKRNIYFRPAHCCGIPESKTVQRLKPGKIKLRRMITANAKMLFRRNINTKILNLQVFYENRVLCVYLTIAAVKRSGAGHSWKQNPRTWGGNL